MIGRVTGHSRLSRCSLVPSPDPRWGEVGHAFVALHDIPGTPTADAIRALCRRELAGYKVPKRVTILDGLPRTSTGKLSRAALSERIR